MTIVPQRVYFLRGHFSRCNQVQESIVYFPSSLDVLKIAHSHAFSTWAIKESQLIFILLFPTNFVDTSSTVCTRNERRMCKKITDLIIVCFPNKLHIYINYVKESALYTNSN